MMLKSPGKKFWENSTKSGSSFIWYFLIPACRKSLASVRFAQEIKQDTKILHFRHGIKDQPSENPGILRPGDTDNIRKCIVSGLFPNAAYLHMTGTFRTVRGDMEVGIHRTSTLYSVTQPSWVVFAELVHTSKLLMREVTVIDPAWLEILAPHYYEKVTMRT